MDDKPLGSISLRETEDAFDALMQGETSELSNILRDTPIGQSVGVNVYRQTSLSALVNAIKETFETCQHILGEDYFDQCATSFCQLYPLFHNDLNVYGSDFPGFMVELVETRDELATLKFLCDLSSLEWALNEAFFADKKHPFDVDKFGHLNDEQRGKLILKLGPNVRLLHSHYNVKDIYTFHKQEENILNERSFDVILEEHFYVIHRGSAETNFELFIDQVDAYNFSVLSAIKDECCFNDLCENFAREIDGVMQPPPFGDYISKGIVSDFIL